ncbi:MAG: Mn-dependent transcriptional regulator [Candidatus Nanosalina sp. J07AB43]|jgi:Mn-dependent transcriptional regulator|nr:MAG: Mn-dependent transcriptional regulator [Candidatus Nanosalina sp. J07AB43]
MGHGESYIRAIYSLTCCGEKSTSTSEVAEHLDVSDASASESIKKLEETDIVCRAAYQGITLSPIGKEKGRRAEQKFNKLVGVFSELGLESPEAEASSVERHISKKAVEELFDRTVKK